ncbi:hypothetical protein SMQC19_46840 (plasmid) [Serratia marcescens]|nr:hypothetical protein SMQC19_46840 [Serratia marcescens]
MPYSRESKEKDTHAKGSKQDNASQEYQLASQGGAAAPSPDEGLSTGSGYERLFAFIREAHLEEAQEFRLKGYNSQVPEVDGGLLTQLRDDLAVAKSRLCLQVSVGGPLGSLWLLDQIGNIERLASKLSDDVIKRWIEHELPRKGDGEDSEAALGSRRTAQSLARRLEAALQILIRVVHTLRAMDDYSTPEKRHNMLVAELTGAFSSYDKSTVIQALGSMTAEISGHTAWVSLMQARAVAREAGKSSVNAMIAASRHEAEKANIKARQLQGDPQTFFSDVAAYLQNLSRDLAKASIHAGQSTTSPAIPQVNNDEAAASLSRSNSLPQRIKTGFDKQKIKAQAAVSGANVLVYRLVRILKHGHLTETPTKDSEHVVADSIIRSILWQWQQPAIKIQYASAALLSKVDELKKIEGILAAYSAEDGRQSEQERRNTPVSPSGEEGLVVQVGEWVSDNLEQENPENQRAAKVETLERLLGGDIDYAQSILARLGSTTDGIQKALERQWMSVNDMLEARLPVDIARSMWAKVDHLVEKFMPDIARELATAGQALNEATLAAGNSARNFSEAKVQASKAQLLAIKVKERLSAESARLTERPLDEHSRGARLAKHWANLANVQNEGNHPPPDAQQVLASLKEQGLLAGTLSIGDPAGYLFATRLAGELENARNDELRLPMSPEQYAALEKGLVEYIVKWGQKRISRGVTRIVIELSFEQALDAVSFNVSSLFRLPYKLLKASIKIPYDVNKVNNYTMPGHDKPYKAIYGLLGKKLKQLGFNLLTAPVPGMVKLAAGAGITAGAALHNVYVGRSENTFSAIYQHVAEGKQSEKIKMGSVGGMVFDSVLNTATTAAFKGAQRGWQSGRNANNVISGDAFGSELHDLQFSLLQTENDGRFPRFIRDKAYFARKRLIRYQNFASGEQKKLTDSHGIESELNQIKNDGDFPEYIRNIAAFARALFEAANTTPPEWHDNIPSDVRLQSKHFDFDRDMRYQDFSDEQKKQTYLYGIQFVLLQIENNERLPKHIRDRAYLARIGAKLLVPVDIGGYKLNNTIFLPDSDGAKSGVLIRLDSDIPYYYVGEGKDLLEDVKWAMPHASDVREKNQPACPLLARSCPGPKKDGDSGMDVLRKLRTGEYGLDGHFNVDNPNSMDIASLSVKLADTMEADYKLKGQVITNNLLISRAIAGAHIPDPGVTATEAGYHLEFTWANLTPAEYLRSFSRPFSTLSGEMQLVTSSIKGETIQETESHVHKAEYIGSWVDATVGAITSFTPTGWVLNTAQSAADIAADLSEGKDPDPLAVAGLVVGCIPGGRIAAKVGKFTRIGGKAVKYGVMLGNKAVDLAIVGRSIKTAVETGEPLAIYQAFLASGMSVKQSYDMARNMSLALKLGKTIEESASLEELEALQNDASGHSLGGPKSERIFKIGSTEMLGRINNGEIEIYNGNTLSWEKGSQLHLLAFRLQNAGGATSKVSGPPKLSRRGWMEFRLQNAGEPIMKEPGPPEPGTSQSENAPQPIMEPVLESRPNKALSQEETALVQETTTHLQTELGEQYNEFTMSPKENCANAAVEVVQALRQSGYTDVRIVELGIWPNGGIDTMPANHYVVMAKKDGVDIVVDLTAGQFERYGFLGPIISTKDDWIYQWQQKLKDKPRLLVKMAPLSGGISTSPFSMDYINPQLTVPDGTLLQRPDWYKRGIPPAQSTQRDDFPAENAQPTLPELYSRTMELDKKRGNASLYIETKTNTKVVEDKINNIIQEHVAKNPIPLDSEGKPKFTVSVIGFGSLARNELLLVSDIDIQIIVVADDNHAVEARAYANSLMNSVRHEWTQVRHSVNSSPDATALEMDSIGGNEGIIVVNSPQAAAEHMKPKKMGPKGYSDIYADSRPVYESEQGIYRTMFDEYEAKLQHTAVNGLVNEALADLGAPPTTLSSAKHTFIRPISLAVGGLYRKLRAKIGSTLPYETNTIERARFLKKYGVIDDETYENITTVLLRAFKWEQEAGLEDFQHGQQVSSSRVTASKTRKMYAKTGQIRQGLSTANDKINKMSATT